MTDAKAARRQVPFYVQRIIPTFLVSILAGILIVNHFSLPYAPLSALATFTLDWTAVVMTFITFYAWIVLVGMHANRLMRRKTPRRRIFQSAVLIGTIIFFTGVAFSDPKFATGANWIWLYGELVTLVPTALRWWAHFYLPFIVLRIRGWGSALMLATFTLTTMRESPIILLYTGSWLNPVMDWLMKGLTTSVMQACFMAAATGAVILCARALVGKEPGLIELEAH